MSPDMALTLACVQFLPVIMVIFHPENEIQVRLANSNTKITLNQTGI